MATRSATHFVPASSLVVQRALDDQREDHPLDRLPLQVPAGRYPADRGTDPESFPDPVQRPGPA